MTAPEQKAPTSEERKKEIRRYVVRTLAALMAALVIIATLAGITHVGLNLNFKKTHDFLAKHDLGWITETIYPHPKLVGPEFTIGQVISERWKTRLTWLEQAAVKVDEMIGLRMQIILRVVFWLWLCFVFMTFFRVFTFMGYTRSLRTALFMGALFYAMLPNPTRTTWDEYTFLSIGAGIILLRFIWVRSRRRKKLVEERVEEEIKEVGPRLDLPGDSEIELIVTEITAAPGTAPSKT